LEGPIEASNLRVWGTVISGVSPSVRLCGDRTLAN
jgi:hypothetical protein